MQSFGEITMTLGSAAFSCWLFLFYFHKRFKPKSGSFWSRRKHHCSKSDDLPSI